MTKLLKYEFNYYIEIGLNFVCSNSKKEQLKKAQGMGNLSLMSNIITVYGRTVGYPSDRICCILFELLYIYFTNIRIILIIKLCLYTFYFGTYYVRYPIKYNTSFLLGPNCR